MYYAQSFPFCYTNSPRNKGELILVVMKDGQENQLTSILPHGSGIDLTWQSGTNGKNVYCFNAFHCMDDNGYYDGWAYFYIVIPLKSTNLAHDFKLHFRGKFAQHQNQKYMLRDYLEDTFYEALSRVASIVV